MSPLSRFIWGFCGSAAVELITFLQVYNASTIQMPERYKRRAFWFARVLLCAMAGGLVIGYKLDNPIVAINVGAATPAILIAFSRGYGGAPAQPQQLPSVGTQPAPPPPNEAQKPPSTETQPRA